MEMSGNNYHFFLQTLQFHRTVLCFEIMSGIFGNLCEDKK